MAQAYAAVQMMDQVVMVSRRDRSYPKMNGEQDDYISVAPKRVAEMLTVSPELVRMVTGIDRTNPNHGSDFGFS